MKAEARRLEIAKILESSSVPVSASSLAERFSVSRQIVVGDIAILRAGGLGISATPRGYVLRTGRSEGEYKVACIHSPEDVEKELNIMVDNGCEVLNVIVEHPIYGEITGALELRSRYDVRQFAEKLAAYPAEPLSSLTGGVHLHTLKCPDRAAFDRVTEELKELGILFTENGD